MHHHKAVIMLFQHRLNCWSDSCFFSGISDLLYLYCDQFVVQSIKWVAIPNDFGMVDNIVQPEWYGGELLLGLLCFVKHGLHIKNLKTRVTNIFGGRGRQFVVRAVGFD